MPKRMILITGGARSGKSSYAQQLALQYSGRPSMWPLPAPGTMSSGSVSVSISRTGMSAGGRWKNNGISAGFRWMEKSP